jgi:hypothetical protein
MGEGEVGPISEDASEKDVGVGSSVEMGKMRLD